MKKTVAAALAAAFVIGGASANVSAAANPFSDVPMGHWAYNSVSKLAAEGVIEGYGDGTYRGDRNITRYEMAQMIAKAMAKNPTGATKAELDRLAAEFRDELDALGVRVAELEKYADKLQMFGKIEYTYKSHRTDRYEYDEDGNLRKLGGKNRVNMDDMIFRFEPVAHVNENWTLRARIDAHVDLSRDTSSKYSLERGWAQGDYKFGNKDLQIKFGRQPLWTNEDGIVWDTEYSGAEFTYGSKWKIRAIGGRLKDDKVGGSIRNMTRWDGRQDSLVDEHHGPMLKEWLPGFYKPDRTDPSSFWAVNLQYDGGGDGIFGGAGYYSIKDDDLKGLGPNGLVFYSNDGDTNKAKIWSANLGYRLGKGQLWGSYAKNTEADIENNSWQALVKYGTLYGGGNQGTKKGEWAIWAGYKKLGSNVGFEALMHDDAAAGTKGVIAGASWAPMDRIVVLAKYFKGKYITGNGDAERLFGRVEFFF